jgi:DNA mismatch repair protein MutL
LLDVIDSLKRSGNWLSSARLGEEVLTKYVCRMAVKANDRLGVAELERLIEDLKECDMPYTCPHGRPTIIEMSYGELEKRFGRSV